MHLEARSLRTAPPVDEDRPADEHHRERREHERRPQNGAGCNLVRPRAAADDRHDWNQSLRQRGRNGCKETADCTLSELEPRAKPFDPVREHERPREQDREAEGERKERGGRAQLRASCVEFAAVTVSCSRSTSAVKRARRVRP